MNQKLDDDHKVWKYDLYRIEANIDITLWEMQLIDSFETKLSNILKVVSDYTSNISQEKRVLISIMFSDDKKIKKLNNQFRKMNKPTNVLSFPPYGNTLINDDEIFLGDIIFSIETIKTEAKKNNKTVIDHLIHLFIHGFLHLLGYHHEKEEEAKIMENLEICMLKKLGIASPYEIIND